MAELTGAALAARGHDVRLVCHTIKPPQVSAPGVRTMKPPQVSAPGVRTMKPPQEHACGVQVVQVAHDTSQETACKGWTPEVVHVVDAVHTRFGLEAVQLARHHRALLAVSPASAVSFWDSTAGGVELCNAADLLFCLTVAERETLARAGVRRPRVQLIPQAPALSGQGQAGRFRARHKLSGPLVLYLGRKARSKGYRELLQATTQVWRSLPEVTFAFAGSASDGDCHEVFARHRDRRILDLGEISQAEKEDAIAACELLCLPSSAEIAPLVYAEAWTYSKPVIAGCFPGVEELVRDGRDGLVVAREAEAIALAVLGLLQDPLLRRELGRRGHEKATAELSWEAVAESVEDGYRRALAATGAAFAR